MKSCAKQRYMFNGQWPSLIQFYRYFFNKIVHFLQTMELKLNDDCLLAIFSKLTIVEQFQNVRFVCKRWFHLIQMFFLNRIISLHLAGSQFDLEQFYRGNDQQKFNNSIIISIENFHSFLDLGHTFPRLKSLQLSYRYSVKSQSSKEFKIDRLLNHFIHTLNSLSIDSVPEPYILQQNLWKTIDQMISLSRLELIGLFEPKLVNTWSRLCHLTINDYDGNLVPILCKLNVNKLTHLELDMVRLSSEQLKLVFNSNKYWGNQLIHLKFGTILFDVDDPNDLKRLINLICTHCKRIQSLEMHIPFEVSTTIEPFIDNVKAFKSLNV